MRVVALESTGVVAMSPDEAERLVERHRLPVYRVAVRLLNDPHEAEDVTQEVLLQLCRTRASLAPGSDEGAWAYSIVINRCRDILRSMRHRSLVLKPETPDTESDGVPADQLLQRARDERRVREALQRLPATYRAVLVLRDLEGQPYKRMCEILSSTETTLKARVIRARRALARLLVTAEEMER